MARTGKDRPFVALALELGYVDKSSMSEAERPLGVPYEPPLEVREQRKAEDARISKAVETLALLGINASGQRTSTGPMVELHLDEVELLLRLLAAQPDSAEQAAAEVQPDASSQGTPVTDGRPMRPQHYRGQFQG